MRREWIEISYYINELGAEGSPSMRREWIEMQRFRWHIVVRVVSLHAEGVD